MDATSDKNFESNHLISDRTEDVVLLDSAATISADLTEATKENEKISLRYAKDEDVDSANDKFIDTVRHVSSDNDTEGESQNDWDRKHEILPVSSDGTKCEFPQLVASGNCGLTNIRSSDH